MEIAREKYLQKLIDKRDNGKVKIVSGIPQCGKSYLLFHLYTDYLRQCGISDDQILCLSLDTKCNASLTNPAELESFVRSRTGDANRRYYVLMDTVHLVQDRIRSCPRDPYAKTELGNVLCNLLQCQNIDLYLTASGSLSFFISLHPELQDRSDYVHVRPLSFSEFCHAYPGDRHSAWTDYLTFGGMPAVVTLPDAEQKKQYLRKIFLQICLEDMIKRSALKTSAQSLKLVLAEIAASVGLPTNTPRLSHALRDQQKLSISVSAVNNCLHYLMSESLLNRLDRYDVRDRCYMTTPAVYYFADTGLCNAALEFSKPDQEHLVENILYTDLTRRGYRVDTGTLQYNFKNEDGISARARLRIDFVVRRRSELYFIQSASSIADPQKRMQEIQALTRMRNSFRKIVVVENSMDPWKDENGILYIGAEQFLLDDSAINM